MWEGDLSIVCGLAIHIIQALFDMFGAFARHHGVEFDISMAVLWNSAKTGQTKEIVQGFLKAKGSSWIPLKLLFITFHYFSPLHSIRFDSSLLFSPLPYFFLLFTVFLPLLHFFLNLTLLDFLFHYTLLYPTVLQEHANWPQDFLGNANGHFPWLGVSPHFFIWFLHSHSLILSGFDFRSLFESFAAWCQVILDVLKSNNRLEEACCQIWQVWCVAKHVHKMCTVKQVENNAKIRRALRLQLASWQLAVNRS